MFRATVLVAGAIVMAWLYRELTRWVARRAERRRERERRELARARWFAENLLDPEIQARYEEALLTAELELQFLYPAAVACPVEEQN